MQKKQRKLTYAQVQLAMGLRQGFSTFFCSWPTKLVRNGVGPLTFNEKHQVSTNTKSLW